MKNIKRIVIVLLLTLTFLTGCSTNNLPSSSEDTVTLASGAFDLSKVPDYTSSPYVVINDNVPYFTDSEKTTKSFENYSDLDALGRCGIAYANISTDIMPTEDRGAIGSVKPTGWHTVKYDFVDGKYLYNRCHLIGFQLAGENANDKNLITGTRYMNVDGMLPFENMVADYVKETDNHVIYRVTPIFNSNELVARGVLMEAYSVEDSGSSIQFNVYVYNVQPGVVIDYATGNSQLDSQGQANTTTVAEVKDFVVNKNSHVFHLPNCSGVAKMSEKNKEEVNTTSTALMKQGYTACGYCHPDN